MNKDFERLEQIAQYLATPYRYYLLTGRDDLVFVSSESQYQLTDEMKTTLDFVRDNLDDVTYFDHLMQFVDEGKYKNQSWGQAAEDINQILSTRSVDYATDSAVPVRTESDDPLADKMSSRNLTTEQGKQQNRITRNDIESREPSSTQTAQDAYMDGASFEFLMTANDVRNLFANSNEVDFTDYLNTEVIPEMYRGGESPDPYGRSIVLADYDYFGDNWLDNYQFKNAYNWHEVRNLIYSLPESAIRDLHAKFEGAGLYDLFAGSNRPVMIGDPTDSTFRLVWETALGKSLLANVTVDNYIGQIYNERISRVDAAMARVNVAEQNVLIDNMFLTLTGRKPRNSERRKAAAYITELARADLMTDPMSAITLPTGQLDASLSGDEAQQTQQERLMTFINEKVVPTREDDKRFQQYQRDEAWVEFNNKALSTQTTDPSIFAGGQ